MTIVHFLITVVLFVLLTPGILVRLPRKGSKWTVAIVHGIVFAVVMHVVYWYVLPNLSTFEGLTTSELYKAEEKSVDSAENVYETLVADIMAQEKENNKNTIITQIPL